MAHLVSIKTWRKDHIVRHEHERSYEFYCKRLKSKEDCIEIKGYDYDDPSVCQHCVTLYRNASRCVSGDNDFGVGSIVLVPKSVSETGRIRIVADQTNCRPNTQQVGVDNWDYKAIEWDEDRPNERKPWFDVSKEEIEKWKEMY
jgi:hypothetical protein